MLLKKQRRHLKVREFTIVKSFASWLSKKNISPNQISLISILFSLFGATCLIAIPYFDNNFWLPLLAFIFIQMRLLCNLFDGMVAIEGNKHTASCELFNDIPDRITDPILLVSAGYSVIIFDWGIALGWFTGLLAVLTAYIRVLSASIGSPLDFGGPMDKQHRMTLLSVCCVATVFIYDGYVMIIGLFIIALGSIITCYNRVAAAYKYLESNSYNV